MRRTAMRLFLAGAVMGVVPLAGAACWVPVPSANSIVFNTTQAGAPFQGQFTQFSGRVCLSANTAEQGLIRVQVQAASVNTGLPELDDALRGPDFFDVTRWPQASFVSELVKALDAGHYQVTGKLTLRDVTREITVPFSFTSTAGSSARLQGTLDFKRLDYHIGLGQWRDTRWVGNEVGVKFSVLLKPAGRNSRAAPVGHRHFR